MIQDRKKISITLPALGAKRLGFENAISTNFVNLLDVPDSEGLGLEVLTAKVQAVMQEHLKY